MLRTKTLLWWIPATVVAMVAIAEGGMHMGAARASRHASGQDVACHAQQVTVDLEGDGRAETVRLVRVGDQAWADVWSGAALRSSTRLGAWHDDAAIEAFDVNGDGKTDVVRRWAEGPAEYAQVWLSDGTAFDEGPAGITGSDACVAQADAAPAQLARR
jgi:hypothetical protein